MMKPDITMQTGAVYKPEDIEDKIYDAEQYKVSPHIECRATFYGSQKNTIATNYFL